MDHCCRLAAIIPVRQAHPIGVQSPNTFHDGRAQPDVGVGLCYVIDVKGCGVGDCVRVIVIEAKRHVVAINRDIPATESTIAVRPDRGVAGPKEPCAGRAASSNGGAAAVLI